jgi:hypothetical protein
MRTSRHASAERGQFSGIVALALGLALSPAVRAEEFRLAALAVAGGGGAGPARPSAPVRPLPDEPDLGGRALVLPGGSGPVGAAPAVDGAAPGVTPVYGALGLPCAAALSAEPAPGGTARLRLDAPCLAGATVTLAHGALAASFVASPSGVVEAVFPAFAEAAAYSARLPDGGLLTAEARVPGAAGYERVVTMWQGAAALRVHAFEYGGESGRAGHVWRGAPRGVQAAEAGRGGFHLSLGTAGGPGARRAEVYSFPAAGAPQSGAVRIALAAAVTPETCGRPLEAETLQLGEGLPGAPVAVRIAMPACDGGERDLWLKNLARDLRFAGD